MKNGNADRVRRPCDFGKWLMVAALLAPRAGVAAQGPAAWVEESRTTVTAHTAGADRRRTITRIARYHTTVRGDTLLLHLDDLAITEVADGETDRLDTDAVIGGFWKLVPATAGWRVVERPFVPAPLAAVSDVGRIADDFFPAAPPALAVDASGQGPDGRRWRREHDLDGARRYTWSLDRASDTTEVMADSTAVRQTARMHETGEGEWDDHGPRGWTRRLDEETEGRFLGRAVRATVVTTVAVRRE